MILKVCFEVLDDVKCLVNIDIFKNFLLLKLICDWIVGFFILSKIIL